MNMIAVFKKTPLGETGCWINCDIFSGSSSTQFFSSLSFPNSVSEPTLGTIPLTMQYLRHLQNAIPHY